MAVFRVNKTQDYTVMSNFHLKDKNLTLKSKGLLSLILSLPEDWNYTTRGLAAICKEGVDSLGTALKELEKAGYIERNRIRDSKGKIIDTEYAIFEKPQEKHNTVEPALKQPYTENPYMDSPDPEKPYTENPYMDNQYTDKPHTENPAQLNTNIINKIINKDILNTKGLKTYPIISHHENGTDTIGYDEFESCRDIVKENIQYDILKAVNKNDSGMLDEIVDLITETVCTKKEALLIAGDTYPAAIVKAKLLRLTSEHVRYVMQSLKENVSDIRNIKKYLLAMLFNSASTIDSYYTAKVMYDMANS